MWLAFFRFAACPFCATRVREIIRRYDQIENSRAQFIGIFPSSKERINKYIGMYSPKFRMVSDPKEKLYSKYKAEASWKVELRTALNIPKVAKAIAAAPNSPFAADGTFTRVPCEFLIYHGSIRYAFYGQSLDDGVDIDLMLEKTAELPT